MGSVTIRPQGQALRLTGAANAAGGTVGVWADAALSSALSLPVVVDSDVTVWLRDGAVTLTVSDAEGMTVWSDRVIVGTAPVDISPLPSAQVAAARPGDTYARLPGLATFCVLGDSTTVDGGHVRNAASAPSGWFTNVAWPFWGQALADSTALWTGSFGLAGINTQTAASTYLPHILNLANKPTYCVVAVGKNNDQDTDGFAAFKAAYTSIVTRLRQAGITPILCTITPAPDLRLGTTVINAHIRLLAARHSLPLVDNYAATVDSTTGLWLSTHTRDAGTHPSPAGAKAMGTALASVLTALEPVNRIAAWLPKSNVTFGPNRGSGATGTGGANGGDPLLLKNTNSAQFWVTDDWQLLAGYYAGYVAMSTPGGGVLGRRATITRGASADLVASYVPQNTQVGDQMLVISRFSATVESAGGGWMWSVIDGGGSDAFRLTSSFTNDLPVRIIARIVPAPASLPMALRLSAVTAQNAAISWSETTVINLTGLGLSVSI